MIMSDSAQASEQTFPLMKASDVAKVLNVSTALAYRLMQTGAIVCVRIGTAVRVRPQDLTTYIEQNLHGERKG